MGGAVVMLCAATARLAGAAATDPATPQVSARWYDSYAVTATFAEGTTGGGSGSSTVWMDFGADRASTAARRLGYHLCAYTGLNAASGDGLSLDNLVHDACDANLTALVGEDLECACGKWTAEWAAAMQADRPTWDDSGGLVFDYAVAPAPAGVKARLALGARGGLTGQVLRGWHGADGDFASTGYSVGGDCALSARTALSAHYLTGADLESGTAGARLALADLNATVTPRECCALAASYVTARGSGSSLAAQTHWWSAAVYARWDWRPGATFTARVERFADRAGWATGDVQRLDAVTLTHEAHMQDALRLRAAVRQTTAEEPMFSGRHGASRHDLSVNLAIQADLTTGGGE